MYAYNAFAFLGLAISMVREDVGVAAEVDVDVIVGFGLRGGGVFLGLGVTPSVAGPILV